jgi:aspartate ammonia-lyase
VFEPIIAFRLLSGMTNLARACKILQDRCIEGITANVERMRSFVEQSIGVITALVPELGYETTSQIAKEALETGRGVYDLVCERGLMTREQLDRLLNPAAMTAPREAE